MEVPVIPIELWAEVMDLLPIRDLATCMRVSHPWKTIGDSDERWKRRAVRQFGNAVEKEEPEEGWKSYYRHLAEWKWSLIPAHETRTIVLSCNGKRVKSTSTAGIRGHTAIKLTDTAIRLFRIHVHAKGPLLVLGFADETFGEGGGGTVYIKPNNGVALYSSGTLYFGDESMPYSALQDGQVIDVVFNGRDKRIGFYRDGQVLGKVLDVSWFTRDVYLLCMLWSGAEIELVKQSILTEMPFE